MDGEMTKEIIIVGASRGLGLGLAREYVSRGWRVTATARDLQRARGLRELAASAPAAVRLETVDIKDNAQVAALAERLAGSEFDVLFVNAGISGSKQASAGRVTPPEVSDLFHTNAIAPIAVAEKLAPFVKQGSGVIAFMSSRVGSVAEESSGYMPLYRASKAALNSMTRSFVAGLKDRGLTVLSLHPGWVRTDMGGPDAPLDVGTSASGLADVLAQRAGTKGHAFLDYTGLELAW
jgi:NAD(P)-dependent dehydrogenase (short-subunit alcohol dehydrogenase family)